MTATEMGKADLHAHTRHDRWGDGNQTVAELFRWVEENTDLDLIAITDHDSTSAARAALDLYRGSDHRFGFIPGVEVTNLSGHLLCYFPSGNISDIPSLRPFWYTVRYAQERGAICVAAHPVYPPWLARTIRRGVEHGQRLDAVEGLNAGISAGAQTRLDGIAQDLAPLVALVGNSDAHEQQSYGSAYTAFPGESIQDFVQALHDRTTRPVFVRRPEMTTGAKRFTVRRSMTRPGWVRNVWRELKDR